MNIKHVVKYSFGITSAVALSLVLEREGKENTIALWHDTKEEDEDCYRFGREVAAYLGVEIIEASDGRSVTQVFIDEGFLGNNRLYPCSRILKQQQGDRYIARLMSQGFDVVVYEGMALPDDAHRLAGRREAWAKQGVEVRFPLIEAGISKDDAKQIVKACWGIRLSRAYDHFDHDNCLNRGCVRGGLEYWGLMWLYRRDVWEKAAAEEDFHRQNILKKSRYGEYPEGTLRKMLPHCVRLARKWEHKRAQGKVLPLMNQPCICAA